MTKGRGLMAAALLLLSACTGAGSNEPTRAVVELTRGGSFTIEFVPREAPKTVANFVAKAREGRYDGLTFHRVEDWVIQGGDPSGNGTGGGTMPSELNQLPFMAGAVGIARGPDIRVNNAMQFFVVKQDARHLDGQYTNFGRVSRGLDVVRLVRRGDVIKTIRLE
jgi:peptidyl-prolyl cis-trans isomerase B (cyclophilin B)